MYGIWLGMVTAALAGGNRLSWQTPGYTVFDTPAGLPEHAEQTCPDGTEVVGGWSVSGFRDLSTRLSWPRASRVLSGDWWSLDGKHPSLSHEDFLFGGNHQVSPLCANGGHCMEYVQASVPSAWRSQVTVSASCSATTYPVVGGYQVTGRTQDLWGAGVVVRVTRSEPSGVLAPTSWTVTARSSAYGSWGLTVQATCVPYAAFAYVRTAPLHERVSSTLGELSFGKPEASGTFYARSEEPDLLPLSVGSWMLSDYGLIGTQARNLLWAPQDPISQLDTPYMPWSAPDWQVRPFGFARAASTTPVPTPYPPAAELLYVAPVDRAAFESAVYCDGAPPHGGGAPWWADVRLPVTVDRPFRPIVWLPFELPVDDPLGPPPFGALYDGLPVGVATYTSLEDQRDYLAGLEAALDEVNVRWVEVGAMDQTLGYDDDVVVLVVPDGSEGSVADWILGERDALDGLKHPTVVLLSEGGEGAKMLGLGGSW